MDGVGRDIVDFLDAIAKRFNVTLVITSGYRAPSEQAEAMFRNWVKLQHGQVYSKKTLPEAARIQLDAFYRTSKDAKASEQARQQAKASFLKLAIEQVGNKSKHSKGRAVDMTQASVSTLVFQAITKRMLSVPEGNRRDIYHFESAAPVPAITDADRQGWQLLEEGSWDQPSHAGEDASCRR